MHLDHILDSKAKFGVDLETSDQKEHLISNLPGGNCIKSPHKTTNNIKYG